MRTLVEHDMWSVTYEAGEDGFRQVAAYFTEQSEAQAYGRQSLEAQHARTNPRVVQVTLWHNPETGNWYAAHLNEVRVDTELHKRNAIKKLTAEERKALGL